MVNYFCSKYIYRSGKSVKHFKIENYTYNRRQNTHIAKRKKNSYTFVELYRSIIRATE